MCVHQVPGQLHGGCSRRLYAGQPTQRPARHHPAADVRGPHPHHLPPGEAAEADLPPAAGGGGGAGQQDHLPGAGQHAVPGVRNLVFYLLYF